MEALVGIYARPNRAEMVAFVGAGGEMRQDQVD
jgi:hypothetical protein